MSGQTNCSKITVHSFPAGRSALKDSVDNKLASLLIVSLRKALSRILPSRCVRQVAGSTPPLITRFGVVPQFFL